MLNLLFSRVVVSLVTTSALIGIILLLKKVLKNHISTKWQYNMRFLFIVILLLPFAPIRYSNFSLGALYNLIFGNAAMDGNINAISPNNGMTNVLGGADWLQDFTLSVNRSTPEYLCLLLIGIWLAGVFVYAVITFICNQKIELIKKSSKLIENKEIREIFEQYKAELKITKSIVFCKSTLVQTPMAIGMIKTYIVLPAKIMEQLSANDIRYAIQHELQHYKSKDLVVNYIICLLQILYWFNPLVHLTFKEIRTDREIACEEHFLWLLEWIQKRYLRLFKVLVLNLNII